MRSRVGANLDASESHEVSVTYCTGTKSRLWMPSSRCAASSLRSKDSTEPMLKK